ncbi:MAG: UbiX family flavin prenyltransferase [Planctomycetaceae bacterium]|nr:UbiX family flavin prenyltransferase [Planctomycetaceae bacterium]
MNTPSRFVLGVTGASGSIYAIRLLQVLVKAGHETHLVISPSGAAVIKQECGLDIDLKAPCIESLVCCTPEWSQAAPLVDASLVTEALATRQLCYHRHDDYMTPIASGSFRTQAMVVCPCSGSTLSGISRAASANLIQRAADVHLKENRKLVLVPRETPLSVIQLENMHRLAASGAVMLPAMPGWYHGVKSLDCLVDFVVSRILDQLEIDNSLMDRWGE